MPDFGVRDSLGLLTLSVGGAGKQCTSGTQGRDSSHDVHRGIRLRRSVILRSIAGVPRCGRCGRGRRRMRDGRYRAGSVAVNTFISLPRSKACSVARSRELVRGNMGNCRGCANDATKTVVFRLANPYCRHQFDGSGAAPEWPRNGLKRSGGPVRSITGVATKIARNASL